MYFSINIYLWLIFVTCIISLYQVNVALVVRKERDYDEISLSDFHSLDISYLFNNKGFGSGGDMDGLGGHFDVDTPFLKNGMTTYSLIHFSKPQASTTTNGGYDNFRLDNSQTIDLSGIYPLGALYLLISSTYGSATVKAVVQYNDQTIDHSYLNLPDWQDPFLDEIDRFEVLKFPLSGQSDRQGGLFSAPIYVNPLKIPVSLTLSKENKGDQQVHLFGLTEYAVKKSNTLIIVGVQPTNQWISRTEQVMNVKIHNTGSKWIADASVHVMGRGRGSIRTIARGYVEKIAPGHIQTTQVTMEYNSYHSQKVDGEKKYSSKNGGDSVDVTITLLYQQEGNKDELFGAKILDTSLNLENSARNFSQTTNSVQQHRAPSWLKDSKFGIFIHWGLYSVPAWAPVGKAYAEWYWWRMNRKDDLAFEYHRQKYGENFNYDDFLKEWKPTHFDPYTWLDVINQSRARYFVFNSKHHDGIALFNTSVTSRSTSKLLPTGRDFVGEFMHAAEKFYPHLKRGIYFSLPEWYHPKYRDDSLDWNGPPFNPYTGKEIPYTGSSDIQDFVNDLQVPQFNELINNYDPDILWCDIGGINNSTVWQSDYFNNALSKGKQVSVNDRCGDGSGSDFTTIEYQTVKEAPSRFWEATRGIDPYSFGFNQETKDDEYATTKDLIETLVDTVSKGGNFLLNIGPDSTGIIPHTMAERLVSMGKWLDIVGPSIFNSIPYWLASEEEADVHTPNSVDEKTSLRFTSSQNGQSIYIFSFMKPVLYQKITVKTPLPIQKNDYSNTKISIMGQTDKKGHAGLSKLDWFVDVDGSTVFSIDLAKEDLINMPILVINITHI